MDIGEFRVRLAGWVGEILGSWEGGYGSLEGRMGLVVALARENVVRGSGGPFGAGVFEVGTGKLVGVGVNMVESLNCSSAHAEVVALALAQRGLGVYDLSVKGDFELVCSTAPCAMCLGAVGWSGVKKVVCGARGADAEAVGFDEGSKPGDWVGALAGRGIEVVQDVMRAEARAVLYRYVDGGGVIYNPRRGR